MSDLDRGCAGGVVTVEREEALAAQLVDHRFHRHDVNVDREDLRSGHPPSTPRLLLRDRHEPEEQLSRRVSCSSRVIEWYRSSARWLRHCVRAAHRAVGRHA